MFKPFQMINTTHRQTGMRWEPYCSAGKGPVPPRHTHPSEAFISPSSAWDISSSGTLRILGDFSRSGQRSLA